MRPRVVSHSYAFGVCALDQAITAEWLARGKTWDNWLNVCAATAAENQLTVTFRVENINGEWRMTAVFRDKGDPR